MKYVTAKGQKMSVFSLGTVQLGLNYGLGEDSAKPSEEKAFQILDRAMELGIDNLDTANNYGDSEAVIGRWLAKRKAEGKSIPWVVTKIGPFNHSSLDVLREDMLRQTEGCRKNLGVDTIDCLMLHNFSDYDTNPDEMRRFLEKMKAEGVCKYTALSAYSYNDYGVIADSGFDATQIPLNLFDWKQIENGGLKKLEQSGMMVFVRSVYLQGLVFQKPETLAPHMEFARPTLEKFQYLCKKYELTPAALALSYALSLPGVTSLVLGSEKAEQVRQNLALMDQAVELSDAQMAEIRELFLDTPEQVLNPALWPKP